MNSSINREAVLKVAIGLKGLRPKVVFIGGAVISLYVDNPMADEIRVTNDIDLTINLETYSDVVKNQEELADLHFNPDPEGQYICSYKFDGIAVDIMPADDTAIGVSNKWYKPGFNSLQQVTLDHGIVINILSAPYFLATKFEAFKGRGEGDYYGSHDFEDIIYVLDNRSSIASEILNSDNDVQDYLKNEISILVKHPQADEVLSMHIGRQVVEERFPLLMEKLNAIIK